MWEQQPIMWAFWDAVNRWGRRWWRSAVAGTTNLKCSAICQYTTLHPLTELVQSFFISWDRGLKDIVWMIYDQGKESIIDHPHYVF